MMLTASQLQPISLSGDQQNGLRLRTLLDKASDVLRDLFRQKYPGNSTQVYNDLAPHKQKLKNFVKNNIITKSQFNIFLPPNGNQINLSKIDVTLSTFCLRS